MGSWSLEPGNWTAFFCSKFKVSGYQGVGVKNIRHCEWLWRRSNPFTIDGLPRFAHNDEIKKAPSTGKGKVAWTEEKTEGGEVARFKVIKFKAGVYVQMSSI